MTKRIEGSQIADRNFNRKQALEKEVKELYADIAIGASGAPTITKALGITSITRNSAGLYTMVLNDKYNRLMSVQISQLVSSAQDIVFQLVSETVSASTKNIVFRAQAAAVATDPASGSRLLIQINVKNSSV